MNKAILILDKMPECCEECRLINSHYDNEYGWQTYCGGDYHRIKEKDKKYFCPLKPLPQKKHNNGGYRVIDGTEWFYDSEHDDGWNDCIDTLLGEEE